MKTQHAPTNPDRPCYVVEDFATKGKFAVYVHGLRCQDSLSREAAENLANESNDKHEKRERQKRLTAAVPDMLIALETMLKRLNGILTAGHCAQYADDTGGDMGTIIRDRENLIALIARATSTKA